VYGSLCFVIRKSLFRQEMCKGPKHIGLLLSVDWNEGGAAKLLVLVKF
jgi:hypothetical protein